MLRSKSMILMTMILTLALVLSGCAGRTGDVGNKNIRPNALNKSRFANDQDNDQNRINGVRKENNNVIGMHGNSRIELSDLVADKVSEIPGIDSAFVIMTDHNAYVAVMQSGTGANDQATQTNKDSKRRANTNSSGMISNNNNKNATGMSNNNNNDSTAVNNNNNSNRMSNNSQNPNHMSSNNNSSNNNSNNNNSNNNNRDSTDVNNNNSSTGMDTNNRMGNNNSSDELSDELKDQIADRVKSMSPITDNVYVSTNPDFLGRMQGYADHVRQGHPIQGLVVEFNALVERIFPAPSGTRAR